MKTFEKIAKRYALTNSYYKHRQMGWPDTLAEIYDYLQQHGELPFRYEDDNWSYNALCERQRRKGVYSKTANTALTAEPVRRAANAWMRARCRHSI